MVTSIYSKYRVNPVTPLYDVRNDLKPPVYQRITQIISNYKKRLDSTLYANPDINLIDFLV